MAVISASNLINSSTLTQATSYATASISPQSGTLLLLFVSNRATSGTANTPTVTGASLTWTQVATVLTSDGVPERLTLFRAAVTSAVSGALTIDMAGQTQFNAAWSVNQFVNADISGSNGANGIVQSNTNSVTATTNPSITLSAFSNINNATLGGVGAIGGAAFTTGGSFTQLSYDNSNFLQHIEWASSNQTTINWTASSGNYAMIAAEIKAAFTGGLFMGADL